MQKLTFLFLACTLFSSNIYCQQEVQKNQNINILFVGNSLTYTNNLPNLVEEYANQKGMKINTEMIAFPNYAIEDHWNDGQVQKLISEKEYHYVLIQQGPSSQSDGRRMLIDYGMKFKNLCQENDAQLCYFMVWASLNYYHTFDNVIKNHTDAASINDAILLPVGEIWKNQTDASKNNELYNSDGFHPSLKGSQLAAKIIVDYLVK